MRVTVDQDGKIELPAAVREALGIAPGSVMDVLPSGGEIRLRPASDNPHLVYKGAVLVYDGPADFDLTQAVRAAREARSTHIAGQVR